MDKLTSVRLDEELWKQVKIHAIQNDMTVKHLIETLLKRELEGHDRKK